MNDLRSSWEMSNTVNVRRFWGRSHTITDVILAEDVIYEFLTLTNQSVIHV